ncbi:hypothetical protein DKT77_16550 [Meridianimarinicoccus roseus]|jgi:hypothetical protein|uniref:Aspartate carbamoyltransferase catalytic subunit n=1 Tax=Meridianimarinicoccus roseus TaxID=2072018 RepID=A0A2V2L8X4_9RHOB|nr:hypothetical protein [Meridianimarinicoccus roseus]PWR01722.1 hypothetical protein DKT77_16550 [Meridianimarinicoccus roseus]
MTGGWDGILNPGERVLWQGQPDPTPDWTGWRLSDGLFGGAFAGFALFWMAMALGQLPGGSFLGLVFPLFGLPFLVLGLQRAGAERLWDAYVRRRTWYTLTDERAFIATAVLGRRAFDAYPITPQTRIRRDGRNLWFATDLVKTADGQTQRPVGFTHLADIRAVHDLMQQVQREAT